MIDFLQGELAAKSPDAVTLRVSGVGFRIGIPLSTYEALPSEGSQARLLTYLHVREDQLSLYGFSEPTERELFMMLLAVSQVGPAVALRVLSSCTVAQFKRFILDEDVDSLKTLVKGIGEKTAKRLIVELQGPVRELAVEPSAPVTTQVARDAIQALIALGESPAEAERAVLAALEQLGPDVDRQRLVQESLSKQ
ncbi:MAG: Holliday junction branch migration protein RuvA [Candidatus Brocadiaceae bacterium]|jgi:Holliday junction DNA helicase RuvA